MSISQNPKQAGTNEKPAKYESSTSNAKTHPAKSIPAHQGSDDSRGQGAEVER